MATKLVSMKLDKAEQEKDSPAVESALIDRPQYPWGLQVRLDERAIDKLGLDELPKVAGELMLVARVTVSSVSSSEGTDYDGKKRKNRNVELQITSMCLEDPPKDKDAATELYEKG